MLKILNKFNISKKGMVEGYLLKIIMLVILILLVISITFYFNNKSVEVVNTGKEQIGSLIGW